jgi:hypothetical protein
VAITEQNHNIAGIQAVYGVRPGCEEEDGIEDEQKGMRVESQIGMKELMSLPHLLQGLYLVLLSSLCNTYDNRRRGSVPLNHRSSGIVHLKHSELWYCPPQSFGALVSSTSIVGALVSSTSIIRSSDIVHLNRSELWYRPPQSFGALVSSTSIVGALVSSTLIGGVGPSPSFIGALVPSTSIIGGVGEMSSSIGALVSSTSLAGAGISPSLTTGRSGTGP